MDEITPTPPPPYPVELPAQRHIGLTIVLILIALGAVCLIVLLPLGAIALLATGHVFMALVALLQAVCTLAELYFAYELYQWKRRGFDGLVIVMALYGILNVIGGAYISGILFAAIGIAILYWVLQLGGPNKAWTRLTGPGLLPPGLFPPSR